jgi:hypothetical protein
VTFVGQARPPVVRVCRQVGSLLHPLCRSVPVYVQFRSVESFARFAGRRSISEMVAYTSIEPRAVSRASTHCMALSFGLYAHYEDRAPMYLSLRLAHQ